MPGKVFIQLDFTKTTAAQNDILIALLENIGYTGFEEADTSLKAFIAEHHFDQQELDAVLQIVPVDHSVSKIEEQNWNAQWESSFEPIVVKDFVAIRASFHKPVDHVKHEIIITPKMSFGTGHHETTYMMLERMEHINFTGRSVIDFGTGTGILAILAQKMGASSITAIDNDDWSIDNARENILANSSGNITLIKAETIPETEKAAIILANINLNIIVANLDAITNAAEAGGIILFSGIMAHDEPLIIKALMEKGIGIQQIFHKNNWIALLTQAN